MGENKKPLYIPINTPDYDAIMSGIGSIELAVFGTAAIIIIIFGITVAASFNNTILAVLICLFLMFIVIITVRRDAYNENLLKKIKIISKFSRSQKQYEYHYYNIYEIPLKNEEGHS